MTRCSIVVVGGGLAGMAAAYTLARAQLGTVTIVERAPALGGLAGTIERGGRAYPLAYHHILRRDRELLFFLDHLGLLDRVRWRRVRMLFHRDGRFHALGSPLGLLRYPMALGDKARFVRLMLKCFRKSHWDDWSHRSAAELVDEWGGPGVREELFEGLTRLKFDLPCSEVSAAWLGARLHHREGSAPLGYVPGDNWTKLLCEGLGERLAQAGVAVRSSTAVATLHADGDRILAVRLGDGTRLACDLVVSALPTSVYSTLVPGDATPDLAAIRYTAILSAIVATCQPIAPRCYWLNFIGLDTTATGLFMLDELNPTLGAPGETILNFTTHVPSRDHAIFAHSDADLLALYHADFRRCFGADLVPSWSVVSRLSLYSPVFVHGYRNPPVQSATWRNVFFAGNYRTFPSVASTGTALGSGLAAAAAILGQHGLPGVKDSLVAAAAAFVPPPMRRG